MRVRVESSMTSRPPALVSVIVPTFNRRNFLQKAVESVLAQTFPDFELLIVDDGSTDSTERYCAGLLDARIRYFRQENRGVSAARNHGIREARSDWIAFLDSDDLWQPQKLEAQLDAVGASPQHQVAYTDEIWIRRGRRVNPKKKHDKYGGWIYERCLPLCIISPSSALLSRKVLKRCGLFDTRFPVCEDYDLWLRVSATFPILFLQQPLIIKVGGHEDQLSRSRWGLDRYRVRAMEKAIGSGALTPLQRRWTARELEKKAAILSTGYGNRNKLGGRRYFGRKRHCWRRVWSELRKF